MTDGPSGRAVVRGGRRCADGEVDEDRDEDKPACRPELTSSPFAEPSVVVAVEELCDVRAR